MNGMMDALVRLLQKPALWQRGAEPFWDDEHISKGMLEAHLHPDWDAASRRHSFIDASAAWLSGLIPAGGSVLDLGCGPGLYAKRLSDRGYGVTGMDFSKRSIAYAESRDAKSEYIYKNYLELDHEDRYDAVLLIYCDFSALTPDERRALLPKVYASLKPGGLFILDVNTEKYIATRKANTTSWQLCGSGGYWSAEPYVCLEATHLYEEDTVAADHYVVVTEDGVKEYLNWFSAYTVQKLADEASPFGFTVNGVFDDVSGRPHTGEGEELCFVLERGAQ